MENLKLLFDAQWTVLVKHKSENMAVLHQSHHFLNVLFAAAVQYLLEKGSIVLEVVC